MIAAAFNLVVQKLKEYTLSNLLEFNRKGQRRPEAPLLGSEVNILYFENQDQARLQVRLLFPCQFSYYWIHQWLNFGQNLFH